jgi:hypothetical protein
MKGTLLIAVMFIVRLGIPALVVLTIGEIFKRTSRNLPVGGD